MRGCPGAAKAFPSASTCQPACSSSRTTGGMAFAATFQTGRPLSSFRPSPARVSWAAASVSASRRRSTRWSGSQIPRSRVSGSIQPCP